MGCDIHCWIDYDNSTAGQGEKVYTSNFAKVDFSRDYWLFGLLAGVRVDPKEIGVKKGVLVPPRGMPEKLSYQVEMEYTLYVNNSEDEDDSGDERSCTRKQAESWVKCGCEWYGEGENRITHPDWHTHSYLYVDELKAIQKQYSNLKDDYASPGPHLELAGVIGAMVALNQGNPKRSRFVFFFDN